MRHFPSYTESNSSSRQLQEQKIMQRRKKTGKDKKQPSQEKLRRIKKDDPKEGLDEFFRNFYPDVAYFIAYTHTRECNPDTIFVLLHHFDNDVEVKIIDSRIKGHR